MQLRRPLSVSFLSTWVNGRKYVIRRQANKSHPGVDSLCHCVCVFCRCRWCGRLGNDAEEMHGCGLGTHPRRKRSRCLWDVGFSRRAFEATSNDAHPPYKAGCLEVGLCTVKGTGKGRDKGWSPDGSQSDSEDRGWSTSRAQIGWSNLDLHT